ncbi:4a-hydroxytetrahydrobiopterin dehydratase [Methanobacterium ferruginis]|uniref:4a-hydroxytetrahydrobiopterin dehydratase n=1 Tax=Methanobacterium ferruginis TaxID=710191 RepID=UPI0025734ECA|nr:4a-hydroxytetrahydrobiopterin dehydratase [Methanobacterium ferruginis]BDZ69381.1 putative pterin-4-alpha-carbinolamine dehydratase [Methanobacterium ferruginis]
MGDVIILLELLSPNEINQKAAHLDNWSVLEDHSLVAVFEFPDFKYALEFTVKVSLIAEEMQHHPEINLSWGKVAVEITTNDRGGLTELDFSFAENVNKLV